MPFHPAAIANYLLLLAEGERKSLSPMQVQKLVYFAHGWHLGYGRGPLSSDEVQAWRWGPVFPDLYHAVKKWGSGSIAEPISILRVTQDSDGYVVERDEPVIPSDDTDFTVQLIERVWEQYGDMEGWALSQLTHAQDGPWYKARMKSDGARNVVIPDDSIREYFERKLDANRRERS